MKETIIAIKDHYENVRGGKKVKVLTKDKKYVYLRNIIGDITVVNDIDITKTGLMDKTPKLIEVTYLLQSQIQEIIN